MVQPSNGADDSRAENEPVWGVYGHDLHHSGSSPYSIISSNVSIKWKFVVGNIVVFPPVIGSDGTIYTGSYNSPNGILHAINPDGTLKWGYPTEEFCNTYSPAIDKNGVVYVGTLPHRDDNGNNHLYAINPDGTKKWAFEIPKLSTQGINIGEDGTIYFGAGETFYALAPDGELRWKFTCGSGINGAPAIADDGSIYLTTQSRTVIALSSEGIKRWDHLLGGGYSVSDPSIGEDGTIYVAGEDLVALRQDGTLKWTISLNTLNKAPSIGPDGTIYVTANGGNLFAVRPNGTINWKFVFDPGIYYLERPIIDGNGVIYFTACDINLSLPYLLAVNSNGSLRWSIQLGNRPLTSPVIGDLGAIYIGSHDYNIYSVGEPERIGPPTPPRNLMVVPGDGYVDVSWQKPKQSGGSAQMEYLVFRGTSTSLLTNVATVSGNETNFHDTAVTNGVNYYYNVKARNQYGDSDMTADPGKEPVALPQKDITPPSIEINGLSNGTRISGKKLLKLSGTSSDNNMVSKIEVSTDGITWSTAEGTDIWWYDLSLKNGPNTVHVRATDRSGNTAQKSITFTAQTPQDPGPRIMNLGTFGSILFIAAVICVISVVVVLIVYQNRKRKMEL